ncbi:MAG: cytochrome c biogenesis protein CcdA [Gammaproteobacteria bacterium]|nr:cytochrome c biogenesis protein CcdA [Gammaproteobacteria bacterium]
MFDVTIPGALVAGLISFLSPCVLPLVPPYLCYIGGISASGLEQPRAGHAVRRVIVRAVVFVLGFSTVFVLLGASASIAGQFMSGYAVELRYLAGGVIILFGLHFLGIFRIGVLFKEARLDVRPSAVGFGAAYLLGLAFAFGWTPCVGPVLAAVLFVAGAEETASRGALLLLAYSVGIGVPFILAAALFGPFMGALRRFRRWLGWVEKAAGVLLILTGVLFVTGAVNDIGFWLLETFPSLGQVG